MMVEKIVMDENDFRANQAHLITIQLVQVV
jgi:hypothetical protein